MTDQDLLTLCAFQEANLETDEGVAAVVKDVLERTRLGYESDRTIAGTIERHAQYSWTQYAEETGHYEDVAPTFAEELARIASLLSSSEKYTAAWARCGRIAAYVQAGTFRGPLFDQLTATTLLYANLAISQPFWAPSSRFIVKIDHHSFFEPQGFFSGPQQRLAPQSVPAASQAPAPETVSIEI